MKCVVRMKFGSHLYGTNTPESDLDFKAVHLPDAKDILLQHVAGALSDKRDKAEGEKNLAGEVDQESYSLQRYLQLLSEGQTPALDMLFAPDDMVIESSGVWEFIRSNRSRFLTKKSAAFLGYCRQQANKYGIRGSRVAAARDAALFFETRLEKLGNTAKVQDLRMTDLMVLSDNDHIHIIEQKINSVGDMGTFIEVCNRKIAFN
jgi:RNA repair pathway DNA polymerase beta family